MSFTFVIIKVLEIESGQQHILQNARSANIIFQKVMC